MPQRFLSLSGFVLAGGESRRMGTDKAKLVLGNETVLARQVRRLSAVCRFVTVLAPPSKFPELHVPVLPDVEPGRGPLGGLLTGLARARTEFNLFLGCDLPFVGERFLRWLALSSLSCPADAVVPGMKSGGSQPLCAVYRRRALPAVRASLASGENRVQAALSRLRRREIPWREIASAGFSARIFDNMNTPQDYETAKRMMNSEC